MAGPLLTELSEHAQQIMYDSLDWPDPARGVAVTASWIDQTERLNRSQWRVVSDINWRRLKYWRRLAAQAVEPFGDDAGEVVTEVLVEHGPAAAIQAWMLAAWMARRLGWRPLTGVIQPGVEMSWRCSTGKGEAAVRIHRYKEGPPEVRVMNLTHHACAPRTLRRLSLLLLPLISLCGVAHAAITVRLLLPIIRSMRARSGMCRWRMADCRRAASLKARSRRSSLSASMMPI